jgi:hypothetical protein
VKLETVDVTTIGENDLQYQARQKYLEYRKAIRESSDPLQRNTDDDILMRSYRQIWRGRRVLHLQQVMSETGLRPDWLPKLAICRADRTHCSVVMHPQGGAIFFSVQTPPWRDRVVTNSTTRVLPRGTFQRRPQNTPSDRAWAIAPSIPPAFRPKGDLKGYHLLWEAHWQAAPVDPLLLKHIGGDVFAVLAQWDLTPLERAVLRGRL